MILTIVIFVLVLGLLILVHELGHFLIAKKSGVKVEEFGIGFPPRIWGKKIGETLYSINAIPLGGFVRMFGEEGGHRDEPRSFSAQPVSKRALIVSAGVFMNFILGFLILCIYFSAGNPPMISDPAQFVDEKKIDYQTMILEVQKDSPAESAGLKKEDIVVEVDGRKVDKYQELTNYTSKRPNQKVDIKYKRDGEIREAGLKLEKKDNEGRMGVMVGQAYGDIDWTFLQIFWAAGVETVRIIGLIFFFVYKIFEKLITRGEVQKGVVGPVGIFMLTKQVVRLGFYPLLRFIAFLSLNLGAVNLLPIPALDGGQLVILGFEKLRGRKIKAGVEHGLQILGFTLLIILIILITYRDVVRLF